MSALNKRFKANDEFFLKIITAKAESRSRLKDSHTKEQTI